MSGHTRGMTLIEVLVATVLLGMLIVATVPLVRSSAHAAAARNPDTMSDVALALDDALRERSESAIDLDEPGPWVLELGAPCEGRVAVLHALPQASDDETDLAGGTWLRVVCDEHELLRWIPLERDEDQEP